MSCVIHSWQVVSPVLSVSCNISCNGGFSKLSPYNTIHCTVPSSKACQFLSEVSFLQLQIPPHLYPAESMFWIQVMLVPTCNVQSGAGKWVIAKTNFLGTSAVGGIASPDVLWSTSCHLVIMEQWSGGQCTFTVDVF
jgi:hypothetical protein